MLRLIFKNLWNCRRQNIWLFFELTIVTILTWIILDPAIVSLSDMCLPLGYDADRIIMVSIRSYPEISDNYNPQYQSDEAIEDTYEALIKKAGNLPDIEIVSNLTNPINHNGSSSSNFKTGNEAIDSIAKANFSMVTTPGDRFFSLYGIEAAEGSPSIEELESGILSSDDVILTESVDRAYWPDQRGVKGKRFIIVSRNTDDTSYINVAGIVKDFRYHSFVRSNAVALRCLNYPVNKKFFSLTMRLREGIDADSYIHDHRAEIKRELSLGNYYVKDIETQTQAIKATEDSYGITSNRNLLFFIAALFLINLIVGVIGCVWLKTGKRISELGLLRSYGALKSQIIRMLVGESVVLATAAFILGEILYLQYAIYEGLSIGHENNEYYIQPDSWVTDFGEHFAFVSAIIYAIIIICVCIGTYFPARHAANITPVDALRDE